jgi:hypothetical protein
MIGRRRKFSEKENISFSLPFSVKGAAFALMERSKHVFIGFEIMGMGRIQ